MTLHGHSDNPSPLGSEWIFEGDYANGFKIVNASSKKVLGVNTSNLATNERTKLALYDADNTDSNVSTLW
uniref:RICIN domain-containing protein n=1 Tax=Prevotellamassilia timonensis TaxID=1852370 RepID=UPI004038D741